MCYGNSKLTVASVEHQGVPNKKSENRAKEIRKALLVALSLSSSYVVVVVVVIVDATFCIRMTKAIWNQRGRFRYRLVGIFVVQ